MIDDSARIASCISLVALALAACVPQPEDQCQRNGDCSDDQRCQLGFCIPATGANLPDASGTNTSTVPSHSSSTGSSSNTDEPSGSNSDSPTKDACPDGRAPNGGEIVINEILAAVPSGPDGDANGDGSRDAYEDEFVELVNRSDTTLDLKGLRLAKDDDVKSILDAVCLDPGAALVVFGGGQPDLPADVTVRVAETRFGFPNSGGTFTLLRADTAELASVTWSNPPSESLTLAPQIEGSTHVPHTDLADTRPASPGRCADGRPLTTGCPSGSTNGDAGVLDAR